MTKFGFISLFLFLQQIDSNMNIPAYGRKTINTSFGVIRGETISLSVDDLPAVTQYLGVPYGVTPNGQVFFKFIVLKYEFYFC